VSRGVAALAAFHLGVLLGVFALARAIASPWGEVPFVVGAIVLVELAVVLWWATAGASGGQLATAGEFRGAGVRWGAIAAVVLWIGLLATWVVAGLVAVWFFEPENVEYNLIGGRYAVLVVSAMVLVPGGVAAAAGGGVLGGAIGIIDHALLPMTRWIGRSSSKR